MVVRHQRIRSKENRLLLLIIATCIVRKVTTFPVNTPTCKDGQKLRTDSNGLHICCNTVVCNTSQDFDFCPADQGHDFCKDCPTGTYSNDAVNTSIWDQGNKVDVCVPKPECNANEVILVGNACQCNINNGHWGRDPNNCQLDRKNCKDAGQQLDLDGKCKQCPNNKFKPESGVYGTCREKRRCKQDEEEIDPGATDRDRTCRKKITIETTTTVTVPTPTTVPADMKGDKENGVPLIYWLLPLICLILLILLALCLGCRYKKELKEFIERQCCCQKPDTKDVPVEEQPMIPQNGLQQNGINKHKDDSFKGEVHENGRTKKNPVESKDNSFHDSRNSNGSPIQPDDGPDSGDGDQTNLKDLVGQPTQEADDNSLPTNTTDLSANLPTGQHHGNNDDHGNVKINTREENFPSLGSSIYDNDHSSQIEQNRSMSSHEANIPQLNVSGSPPNASIPQQTPTFPTNETSDEITQEKSVYGTAESGAHGNIPESNLFHSLNTRPDNSSIGVFHTAPAENNCNGDSNQQGKENEAEIGQQNNRERKVQLPRNGEKKDRPKAKVQPIPRTPSTENPNQENPANNANTPSATTTYGQEVQQATNEENHKVVANAEYPLEWRQPLNVDMSGRRNDGNGRGNDGNGEDNQSSSSQDEHGESMNDYVQVVPVTGVESQSAANPPYNRTTSGNVIAAPESENSQESSTSNESSLQHENGTSSTGAPEEHRTGES